MPLLILLLNKIYVGVYHQFAASFLTLSVIRFILSFIVLMVPATLMGGTLPVLSKFLATRLERLGLKVGSLYSINTIGGAVGCFVAGFVLIQMLQRSLLKRIRLTLVLIQALLISPLKMMLKVFASLVF